MWVCVKVFHDSDLSSGLVYRSRKALQVALSVLKEVKTQSETQESNLEYLIALASRG